MADDGTPQDEQKQEQDEQKPDAQAPADPPPGQEDAIDPRNIEGLSQSDPIEGIKDRVFGGQHQQEAGAPTIDALRQEMPDAKRRAAMYRRYDNPFAYLHHGLEEMRRYIGSDADFMTLWQQLHENITFTLTIGQNLDRRTERYEIIRNLNLMALEMTGQSFNHYCGIEDGATDSDESALPTTLPLVKSWYASLPLIGKCFVLAAFVLHGAPYHRVYRMAHDFQQMAVRTKQETKDTIISPDLIEMIDSDDVLRQRTFTFCQQDDGALRLFWRDAQFDLLVRRFVALEAGGLSFVLGKDLFLKQLEQWPVEHAGEDAWMAARALGAIWWVQDQERLFELAATWARTGSAKDGENAAALLDSAYAVEKSNNGTSSPSRPSVVLKRLSEWVGSRQSPLLRMAASTYSLIGRKEPNIALDGLDIILRINPNSE